MLAGILAKSEQIALMCAEAVPWRCHRSLIADALLVRGVSVEHIISQKRSLSHSLTPFAKINGMIITYPSESDFTQLHNRNLYTA